MLYEDFGLRLKRIRRYRHLTQVDISKHLKISRQAYSNYEQGRCLPSLSTLAALSIILKANLFSYFLQDALKHQYPETITQQKFNRKDYTLMPHSNFASTLTEKRIAAGYTQNQAAELLYLSRSTYNHYENGTRIPSTEILIEISLLYKTDLMDLLIPLIPAESLKDIPVYTKINSKENLSLEEKQILSYYRALDISGQLALTNMAQLLNRSQEGID